mgnify:CR=1 FL=1
MKSILTAFALTGVGLFANMAFANNVAVWNSQVAISNSNFAKAKIANLEASLKPKQQQLQTYKANIDRLQQQFDSQQGKLTDAQKQDLAKQVQTNMQGYDQVAEQIQTTLTNSENEVLQRVSPTIKAITEGLIKQKNIDILLDSRDRNVTFVKPEWDITNEVTQKLNEQVR